MMVISKWSPCPYLDSWAFIHIFFSLSCWGEGGLEQLGGHLATGQGQLPTFRYWKQNQSKTTSKFHLTGPISDLIHAGYSVLQLHLCQGVTHGYTICNKTLHVVMLIVLLNNQFVISPCCYPSHVLCSTELQRSCRSFLLESSYILFWI